MRKSLISTVAALALGVSTVWAAPPDSVVIGMVLEPPGLDPTAGAAAAIDEVTYDNIFEGLTRFAADGSVQPLLAESWEVSSDGRVYTFTLNHGVKFHDGTEFNAADVVFSLNRARAEGSTNAQKALFANIEKVEAPEPFLVKITLKQPDGGFPVNLAWGDAVIVAEESAAGNATQPIGTGPYKFVNWAKGTAVELERNPDYWGPAPAIPRATFKFISDPSAAFAAVMAGDVDAFPMFPAAETLEQFKADPRFQVIVGTTEGETILAMNNRNVPLNDVRVREAITHAIDRQALIEGAMFGYGTPIGTHFAPGNPDYEDLTALSAYDPAKSKALLKEAGAEGLKLRLALPPPPYARRGGEIVAAQLRAVGIETEVTTMEWAQWLDQVFKRHDFDLTIISHVEPLDINIYARPDYYFGYGKPEFIALMDRLAATVKAEERSLIWKEAQEMIAKDYVNAYLFQLPKAGVADARLKGLWQNAPTPAYVLGEMRWEE